MNRNFYKKMKNYKEIKGFIQNGYIRIADMNKLDEILANLNRKMLHYENHGVLLLNEFG